MKLTVAASPASLSRVKPAIREPLRVGLVQTRWHEDAAQHAAALLEGIRMAAEAGAKIVFLQELTLSRYPADVRPAGVPNATAESLTDGPTYLLAAKAAAENNIHVHASLFEYDNLPDGRGWNTAIIVAPNGDVVAKTRKLHIPVTAGYYEAMTVALREAATDPTVGSVVLTGEGGHFCSGGDLRRLAKSRELTQAQRRVRLEGLHDLIRAVGDCPKPVIAAVEGAAAGAGLSLALACDMLVTAKNAVFSVAYVKVVFFDQYLR